MGVEIELDLKDLTKRLARETEVFRVREVPEVMARVINNAAANVRTNMKKEAVAGYEIDEKKVAKTIKTKRANPRKLNAEVVSKDRPLALRHFPVDPPKRPSKAMKKKLKVKIKKNGGFQELNAKPSGFWARENVFAREGKSRLPIRRLYTLSIPQMISKPEVLERIQQNAQTRLEKKTTSEIKKAMKKIKGAK